MQQTQQVNLSQYDVISGRIFLLRNQLSLVPRHTHFFSPGHFCCFLQQIVSYSATKWQRRQKKHMYYLCGKIQVQNPQFQNTSLPVNDSNHTVNNVLLYTVKKNVVITTFFLSNQLIILSF